jgi:cell division protease FtsH
MVMNDSSLKMIVKNYVISSDSEQASDQDKRKTLPPKMIAAMAMSPIAALSLSLVHNDDWAQSMKDFFLKLRVNANIAVENDGFKHMVSSLDEKITFMDWTYKLTGIDLTYVWDPELWVKFKDAIWTAHPQMFWNELADRIEYSKKITLRPR